MYFLCKIVLWHIINEYCCIFWEDQHKNYFMNIPQ